MASTVFPLASEAMFCQSMKGAFDWYHGPGPAERRLVPLESSGSLSLLLLLFPVSISVFVPTGFSVAAVILNSERTANINIVKPIWRSTCMMVIRTTVLIGNLRRERLESFGSHRAAVCVHTTEPCS